VKTYRAAVAAGAIAELLLVSKASTGRAGAA
jgi:hypothetical protein